MASRRGENQGQAAVIRGRGPRQGSFSLVETLVVLAIITLLIAILVPSLGRARQQATEIYCQNNVKQIGLAIRAYMHDYNGWAPVTTGFENAPGETGPPSAWYHKLGDYLVNSAVFACPADPAGRFLKADSSMGLRSNGVPLSSYGLNEFILNSPNQELANLERYRPKRPHNTLLAADMGPDAVYAGTGGPTFMGANRTTGLLPWDDGYEPGDPQRQESWLTERHQGGINVLTVELGVHNVSTRVQMGQVIQPTYGDCLAAGCTLCLLSTPHYSFAASDEYWWTGPAPPPSRLP